jgi:hypothetical protein
MKSSISGPRPVPLGTFQDAKRGKAPRGEDPPFFCWSKVNSQHFWLVESFIFAGDFSFHWSNHSCCWLKFIVFFFAESSG